MRIKGVPNHLLLAPDKFKGTFTATEVATALRCGLAGSRRSAGEEELLADVCPVADGGEGTLDALGPALALERVSAVVADPLGRPVEATFGIAESGLAVVEMASASGLALVQQSERDPLAASTFGTGELIAAALHAGAQEVYVAAGGSATTDGGEGAIEALRAAGGLGGARLTVLCDVRTAFEDAARIFAAQKGANADAVLALSERLQRQASAYRRDPRGLPMTGAAGGLAGGLWAEFGAELVSGAAFVLNAVGYDERMRAARAVVTGEGRLDRQSLVGKVVSEVATRARQAGVPCHAVVGANRLERFDARILDLQVVLEASTLERVERAGARIAELIMAERYRGR